MDGMTSALMAYFIAIAVFVTTALFLGAEKSKMMLGGAIGPAAFLALQGHAWYIVFPMAILGHLTCCVLVPKST